MARRKRRSTRKGQRRKTARPAYFPMQKARTRRRRYGRAVTYRRAASRRKTGIVKARAMGALKECGWITGGGALGLAANRFMPQGFMGYQSDLLVGAGALAYGVYRNDPKPIYLGFGALYPRIQQQVARLVG